MSIELKNVNSVYHCAFLDRNHDLYRCQQCREVITFLHLYLHGGVLFVLSSWVEKQYLNVLIFTSLVTSENNIVLLFFYYLGFPLTFLFIRQELQIDTYKRGMSIWARLPNHHTYLTRLGNLMGLWCGVGGAVKEDQYNQVFQSWDFKTPLGRKEVQKHAMPVSAKFRVAESPRKKSFSFRLAPMSLLLSLSLKMCFLFPFHETESL